MTAPANPTAAARHRNDLVARFSMPLRCFFLRRVKDRAQAEDLAQEVLLRVIRAAATEVIENPHSYVFKAAAHLLLDHRRRVARSPILRAELLEDVSEEWEGALVEDRSPERVLLGEVSLAEVLRALGELGELTRSIFVLFRLESMRQKDIAALYGIGQSTVEKHVMRAMVHLAKRCGHR